MWRRNEIRCSAASVQEEAHSHGRRTQARVTKVWHTGRTASRTIITWTGRPQCKCTCCLRTCSWPIHINHSHGTARRSHLVQVQLLLLQASTGAARLSARPSTESAVGRHGTHAASCCRSSAGAYRKLRSDQPRSMQYVPLTLAEHCG
jgi:hypothetical protein